MIKPRTTVEKRAAKFCEEIRQYGSASFAVEWKKSKTWGMCPSIQRCGEKIAHASGYGYCKESACLVEALRFLGADLLQQQLITRAHGCGVETVIARLAECGWTLRRVFSTRTADAYEIRRAEVANAVA